MNRLVVAFIIISLIGLIGWGIRESRHETTLETEREKPFESSSDIKDGVITIDQDAFAKSGMMLAEIKTIHGKLSIPVSAIVWWDGKAWVYKLKEPDHYLRASIEITRHTSNESYEVVGLSRDEKIVVTGAQLLLSTELGSGAPMGDDD